jgi:hypothetical protein
MKKTYLFSLLIAGAMFAAALGVKNVTTGTSYRLVAADADSIINITVPSTFKVIVPLETAVKDTFSSGTKIYGSSLTDNVVWITWDDGVTVINPDNAFRTKHLGSQWTLTKVKRNVWLLDGDLYSTEIDAYVGDDITIKADVDPNATGPFVFTWYKDNVMLAGQTNASLKMVDIKVSDAGNYKVDVRNNMGYASSEVTNLMVR